MKKSNRRTALLLLLIIVAAGAGYLGLRAGRAWESNNIIAFSAMGLSSSGPDGWDVPKALKLYAALREVFGLDRFHADYGQDKWIIRAVFPGVTNGYYVDVGAADGVLSSNTRALDDLGWTGLCIDPFPKNMEGRRCRVCRDVVYSASGEKVAFKPGGFLGGIAGQFGATAGWLGVKDVPAVEFTTVTLADILVRAGAPRFIHYMSIDIEGAELEALKGFPFPDYRVGALTIEHNFDEPKRSRIRSLLESNGYRYVVSLIRDDCYVAQELLKPQTGG